MVTLRHEPRNPSLRGAALPIISTHVVAYQNDQCKPLIQAMSFLALEVQLRPLLYQLLILINIKQFWEGGLA